MWTSEGIIGSRVCADVILPEVSLRVDWRDKGNVPEVEDSKKMEVHSLPVISLDAAWEEDRAPCRCSCEVRVGC